MLSRTEGDNGEPRSTLTRRSVALWRRLDALLSRAARGIADSQA